eukprot:Nitzschia sp. Nitz4//scaffold63_size106090//75166//75890//NITZ4_004402-RA/size106090-processed-gene-0.131-mRNA-1//1//CDS//3329556011//1027//frame0
MATIINPLTEPFMIVMVGLPGSGKSTLAQALVDAMPETFFRVNQDQLGSRKRCEQAVREAMSQTHRPCILIDRCNFDEKQRSTWYKLALQNRYKVYCWVLSLPKEQCIQRCQSRPNHETVAPHEAEKIIRMVASQYKAPTKNELSNYQGVLQSIHQLKASKSVPEVMEQALVLLRQHAAA